MQIGPYQLPNNLILAPMAGVTDRPFRQLCRNLGAGMAVSEMVSSNSLLWGSTKTQRRANHCGESEPKSVQIAGADPQMMAEAARYNADQGAQIIDINMGCPAKKICNVMAGSALLQHESLVADILQAVVQAVDVPVTCADDCPHCRRRRHPGAGDSWPHPCRPIHRQCRVRHHRASQAKYSHPCYRKW